MPAPDRLRILITGVGSLLGQNLLDALEGRRDRVHVIGANLDACNPRLFRCDVVYLVPPIEDAAAFRARILEIIERERPELWLPARDHDVVAQAELKEALPDLAAIVPSGAAAAARMMQDKWLSHLFAAERGLRFAESALLGPDGDPAAALALAERHGFPLLAKPRQGYGSHGVLAILDRHQLDRVLGEPDLILQQFVSPPDELDAFARRLEFGVPLFSTLAERQQYVCQTVIGPDGRPGEICAWLCANLLVGRPEHVQLIDDPKLVAAGRAFAEAAAGIGWVGSFNLQLKRRWDGEYVAFEMNGRMVGTTSARLRLGYDEMAILVRQFLGADRLPDWSSPPARRKVILKTLVDDVVDLDEVERLQQAGVWRADG